jgi:hypothetical protein
MASDVKKTKADPAPKKEAVATAAPAKATEAAPAKAAEAVTAKAADAAPAKAEGGETAAAKPASYSRGEGQKPVTQAYKDNWNAIFATKKTVTKKTKKKAGAKKKTRARYS